MYSLKFFLCTVKIFWATCLSQSHLYAKTFPNTKHSNGTKKHRSIIWKYLGFTNSMFLYSISKSIFLNKKCIQNTLQNLVLTLVVTYSHWRKLSISVTKAIIFLLPNRHFNTFRDWVRISEDRVLTSANSGR